MRRGLDHGLDAGGAAAVGQIAFLWADHRHPKARPVKVLRQIKRAELDACHFRRFINQKHQRRRSRGDNYPSLWEEVGAPVSSFSHSLAWVKKVYAIV
jgi:hypothetical protein